MDIKEVEILGDAVNRHWYYSSKAKALVSLLKGFDVACVLDIGAGSGFFSRSLLRSAIASAAICVDTAYVEDRNELEAGRPIQFRRQGAARDADLLLMMDVLEHVEDDEGLLRTYADQVRPGGTVIISVPAFGWLWSPHDDFLGHRRRYTLPQVEQLMRGAGLERVQSSYYFAAVFPMVVLMRLAARFRRKAIPASDLRRHSAIVNGLLSALCQLELLGFKHNRLVGLTVFCVGRRSK